jgi:putative Mn2+ efflux pump MntP
MINVLVIAFGLSLDSFSVSVVLGGNISKRKLFSVGIAGSVVFGLFHAGMLTTGFFIEETFKSFISGIDHWVAFILLFIVGTRMIHNGLRKGKRHDSYENIDFKLMISLALATSVDALIIGMGIAFLGAPVLLTIVSIGLVVFLISFSGFCLGMKGNNLFHKKAGIAGGYILIIMGMKILVEHLVL